MINFSWLTLIGNFLNWPQTFFKSCMSHVKTWVCKTRHVTKFWLFLVSCCLAWEMGEIAPGQESCGFLKLSIFVTLGNFNRSRHRSESDILLLVILPIVSRAKRLGKLLNRKELDLADVRCNHRQFVRWLARFQLYPRFLDTTFSFLLHLRLIQAYNNSK